MESGGAAGGDRGLELVVFPWLAFGHMIPFLELSKRLAGMGHAVSFVSTPRNLARLPPVPPELSGRLRFVPLPLPAVEGLPEGAESTTDVPHGKIELLKKAMDGLADPLKAFLAGTNRKPDWIIVDFCHHWVPPIADRHKVPCAAFIIIYATCLAFWGPPSANAAHPRTAPEDFTVPPKWIPSPSTAFLHRHEAEWVTRAFHANVSGVSDTERTYQVMERCRLSIYRSCHELEPRMFDLLSDLYEKPAIPAGILLPPPPPPRDEEEEANSSHVVLEWLDDQKAPRSVIYVSLGTEAPLSRENIHELALGLELAGVRFLWALRKPAGANNDKAELLLPAGFEERTRARGLVCTEWVPQVKVLSHGATGAFLTHCGWGSTIESLACGGLPLVMLPFIVDQPLIARAMAERQIGVEVARDESDGSFDRDGVAAAVRRVMVEKAFASSAKKLRVLLGDQGRQEQYIDNLVDHLRRHKM